jgi:hypothetical protein
MDLSVPERRRSPRVPVAPQSWLAVPSTWPVQLVDLSVAGMAFSSPYSLEVGRTAAVRTTLGGDAFSTQIRVCWSRPRASSLPARAQFEVGAVFLDLDAHNRRALESFLKMSSPE